MTNNTENSRHLENLAAAVVSLNIQATEKAALKALEAGVPPMAAISSGLAEGMRRIGEKFSCGEYFVPEVLVASRALYAGMNLLTPHLPKSDTELKPHVVLGVVNGDIHDIGKNIIKLFWESSGFRVIDLGKNVPPDDFLRAIGENQPYVLALSTLMTSTLSSLADTVSKVRKEYNSNGIKIMVGGASVSAEYAEEIGADFYGENGSEALDGLKKLIGEDN